jgi:3-hydroxyisobutyrate dehydrogenase-like beta-hydroxyacid dehydrogenase
MWSQAASACGICVDEGMHPAYEATARPAAVVTPERLPWFPPQRHGGEAEPAALIRPPGTSDRPRDVGTDGTDAGCCPPYDVEKKGDPMPASATVTVLGLGRMGSSLAEAFIAAGHEVTVWNRDGGKRTAFEGRARIAATAADACAASDLIGICVADYDAANSILADAETVAALAGRTLVQFSSGGPDDARAMGAWASANRIDYLDGAILTYPDGIGADHPDTVVFYSGARDAFDRHKEALLALGGRPTFVGEAVGGAAAADLAWLGFEYGATAGLLQGAAFCEAEDVDPAHFFDAVKALAEEVTEAADRCREMIAAGDFRGDLATLDVHVAAIGNIVAFAEASGVDGRIPAALLRVFGEAAERGHGGEEIAAAVEVFRGP